MKKKLYQLLIFSFCFLLSSYGFSDEDTLIKTYEKAGIFNPILLQTPFTGSLQPKIEIVLFSDFYCSHCKYFMQVINQVIILPEYKNLVKFYYKIYPLSYTSCSQDDSAEKWTPSCKIGLVFLELNRKGLFWQFEKFIRENSISDISQIIKTAEKISQTKLDINTLKEKNAPLLFKHITQANELKVEATPTWFINGRKIEGAYTAEELIQLFDYIIKGKKDE